MQYQGLFVGLTTIDIQYFVDEFPEQNTKIKTKAPDILVGGPASNAAVAFSQLNKGVNLATVIGRNSFTPFIKEDFRSNSIQLNDIAQHKNVTPVIASVVTSANGNRNIFTHNPLATNVNTDANKLFANVNPSIVLVDGFYPEFSLACIKLAKEKGIPVVTDCGSWKPQYMELLKYTDIAICSNDFYPPKCENSTQVFNFVKSLGPKQIAISRGDRNILFQDDNNSCEITIRKLKVVDTLGAGDFLHGAFCYYFLEEKEIKSALLKASEMATFSCQYKGTREWLKFWK